MDNTKQVIFLFFPPLINNFNFVNGEKIKFISSVGTDSKIVPIEPWLKKSYEYCRKELENAVKEEKTQRIVFVNYPVNLEHFQSVREQLSQYQITRQYIILLDIAYERASEISENYKEYLICPLCNHIHLRTETIQSSKSLWKDSSIFTCPNNSLQPFSLEDVETFNRLYTNYYLENSTKVVNSFIENKCSTTNSLDCITQITVNEIAEIFNGQVRKKILDTIANI